MLSIEIIEPLTTWFSMNLGKHRING